MDALLMLWAIIALSGFAGWCLYVVFSGLTEKAPLELQVAWWIGRLVLAIAAVALLLISSKGLLLLSQWVMTNVDIP